MIIFRYVARDILATTFAVTLVLVVVITSSRFVKYLAQAAAGQLDANVLFAVIGYRMPGFLELIIPLAFFLAVLLVYGRMYVESEMTVLHACGVGPGRFMVYAISIACAVAVLVGWLALSVSPGGLARAEALLNEQKERSELESMDEGRFYSLRGGRAVMYSGEIDDSQHMTHVFVAEAGDEEDAEPSRVIVFAEKGSSRRDSAQGDRFLVLENGYRIEGVPGRADFTLTSFAQYGHRLARVEPDSRRRQKVASLPTADLLASDDPARRAALQWRISSPLLLLVVTLLAVPLARTNPRQGRFIRIFPAIILYMLYLVALNGARGMMEEQAALAVLGLWWVHFLFLAIGLVLLVWSGAWRPAWLTPKAAMR